MVAVGTVALGAVVAVVGGGLGLRQARRAWRRRGEIRTAEGVAAGSLRPGIVQVRGTAEPAGETFTSPLTGQECLAYAYSVEERQRVRSDSGSSGARKTKWVTIQDVERAAPFYVDDGTGRALVDAPVAEFALERAYEVDSDDAATGAAGKLLATATGRETGPDAPVTEERLREMREANSRRRYEERLILPGEPVYVYGEAMPPRAIESGAAGTGSIVAGLAGLLESGSSTSPVISGAMSLFSGGSGEYRRAKRKSANARAADFSEAPDGPSPAERRARLREMAAEMEDLQGRDPESLSAEERRRLREMADSVPGPAEQFSEAMENVTSPTGPGTESGHGTGTGSGAGTGSEAGAVTGTGTGGGRSPFAGEDLAVSRGESVADFVVSDREKGGVVRSYTRDTLKWAAIAAVFVALGGGLLASGLGMLG